MLSTPQIDDRRDIDMRQALLDRIRGEIQHTPGLALTPEQASRLFGIPHDVCERLLSCLAREGAISVRPDGRFVGIMPVRES